MTAVKRGRWRRPGGVGLLAALLLAPIAIVGEASAANVAGVPPNPADLDVSFGGAALSTPPGMAAFHLSLKITTPKAVTIQPDGKTVILAGFGPVYGTQTFVNQPEWVLVRLNRDGSPDPSFDDDGMRLFDPGPTFPPNHGIAGFQSTLNIMPDGKILVGGALNDFPFSPILVRFNSDGSIDNTWGGGDGMLTLPGFVEYCGFDAGTVNFVKVSPDGKIDALIDDRDLECANVMRRLKLNADGSFASDFGGGDGIQEYSSPLCNNGLEGLERGALLTDGSIISYGRFVNAINGSVSNNDTCVNRWNADGSADLSFAGDGTLEVGAFVNDLAVQSDGKVVVAAGPCVSSNNTCLSLNNGGVFRFNANGTPDLPFIANAGPSSGNNTLEIRPNGKIVVVQVTPDNHFSVERYNVDGSRDLTFVGLKKAPKFDSLDPGVDDPWHVVSAPDGRIVVAGRVAFEGAQPTLGVARFIGDLAATLCPGVSVSRVFIGTSGGDSLVGTSGRDLMLGEAGRDSISGNDGGDCIYGGLGRDVVTGGAGKDRIFLSAGDTKAGSAETISGGSENDSLLLGASFSLANVFGSPTNFTVIDPVTSGPYAAKGVEQVVVTP